MNTSVNINELFKGVAVVIDDEVYDKTANIQKILDQISSLHIPVVKYADIPPDEDVSHFQSLSFVFLDWRLIKTDLSAADLAEGVSVPSGLEVDNITRNIEFIKRLYEICYCPIFIFTNEDADAIMNRLVSENVCLSDRPSNILIKSKSSLQEICSFQNSVENWIKANPSIYILKEWEREYQTCKNRLFFDFQQMSPVWPQVMWECFSEDGGNKSLELGELISRNLHTRMRPFEFNEDLLKCTEPCVERAELRKVLEGARFLKKLHEEDISTGDVFREEYLEAGSTKNRYWLNIRAQCDTIRNYDGIVDKNTLQAHDNTILAEIFSNPLDRELIIKDKLIRKNKSFNELSEDDRRTIIKQSYNPSLYCLPGIELIKNAKGKNENISFSQGEYLEKGHHAIVPFIDDGKIILFEFGGFQVLQWKSLSTDKIERIGRILPPYITKIQQRFALYLHRQGLPRIPKEAI